MLNSPLKTAIDQLVSLRYPLSDLKPVTARTNKIDASESNFRADQQEKARLFRAELEQMTAEEVQRLLATEREAAYKKYEERRTDEERARPFNQAYAKPNYSHWAKMSYWSLEECVALSLDRDPAHVSWQKVQALVGVSAFASAYSARREIISRAKIMGQLWDMTIPTMFVAWAARMQIPITEELVTSVEELGTQIRDWKSACEEAESRADEANRKLLECMSDRNADLEKYRATFEEVSERDSLLHSEKDRFINVLKQQLSQQPPETKSEKSLSTRERESLLKLVIGMAVGGYGFDANANRTRTSGEIVGDLQRLGLSLDEDTVRKYLQEAKGLIPSEPKD
jgi:hypothetical protein